MIKLLDEKKSNWQRLEDLLNLADSSPLGTLTKEEVRELGQLYRRASSDLAIARAETRDPKLLNYLNSLVIRGHGKIYRAESQGVNMIWNFFAKDFPQTFRKHFNYFLISISAFFIFAIAGFSLTWQDSDFGNFVYLQGIETAAKNNDKWWLSLNEANQIGSSGIMTNNVLVTFKVFAMGAFFGIGSFYDVAFEGMRFGSVFALCYKVNPPFGDALAGFVVGHGVIELSCIFICGCAGMLLGYSLINPKDLTRTAALKKNGIEATKLVIGTAFLLVIAGIIEGFLSPSNLPVEIKYATGILTGIAMYSYLLLVGHEKTENLKV
jgi:uncharacterized membrane protein SpoIIM required for sporulation